MRRMRLLLKNKKDGHVIYDEIVDMNEITIGELSRLGEYNVEGSTVVFEVEYL